MYTGVWYELLQSYGKTTGEARTSVSESMDAPFMRRTCSVDVSPLIRYGTCAGHLRDMCGTSYPWPRLR